MSREGHLVSDLRELLEKAGPLPWVFVPNQESQPDWGGDIHAANGLYIAHDHEGLHGALETPDAALIVAAINALPTLLRLIEGTDQASPEPSQHEIAYRLDATLSEAAAAGVTFDARNRADLARLDPTPVGASTIPPLDGAAGPVLPVDPQHPQARCRRCEASIQVYAAAALVRRGIAIRLAWTVRRLRRELGL